METLKVNAIRRWEYLIADSEVSDSDLLPATLP